MTRLQRRDCPPNRMATCMHVFKPLNTDVHACMRAWTRLGIASTSTQMATKKSESPFTNAIGKVLQQNCVAVVVVVVGSTLGWGGGLLWAIRLCAPPPLSLSLSFVLTSDLAEGRVVQFSFLHHCLPQPSLFLASVHAGV